MRQILTSSRNSHGLLGILMYWSGVVGASALSPWYDGALETLLLRGKWLYHDDIWLLGWCGNQANSYAHLRIEVGSSDSRSASQFLPKNAYSWSHPRSSGRAFCFHCGCCECEDNYSLSILCVNKTKYLESSYTEEILEYFHFTFDFRRTIFAFWYLPPRFRRLVLSSRVLFNLQIYKPSISQPSISLLPTIPPPLYLTKRELPSTQRMRKTDYSDRNLSELERTDSSGLLSLYHTFSIPIFSIITV